MGRVATKSLHQKAAYWARSGVSDYGGVTISAAIEVDCRWEKTREESKDEAGNTIIITGKVAVDRDITVGSLLRLGTLVSVPSTPDNLEEVIGFSDIPNIKNRSNRRVALTKRLSDELPTIS